MRVERPAYALAGMTSLYAAVGFQLRWFNDDAFITFRYGRHLADGFGLVWNVLGGSPVEGSTSLGWTLLSAASLLCGLDPLHVSWVIGLAFGAAGLWLAWWGGRELLGLTPAFALLAPAMLFLNRQYVLSSVSGMETRAGTILAFAATLMLIRELRDPKLRGFRSGGLFLLATIVRPEVPLLHAAAGAGALAFAPSRRAFRQVLESGGVHLAGLALLTLWRIYYFGQPLPNPFYVKVGATQLGPGLAYIGQYLLQNHVWLSALVVAGALPMLVSRRERFAGILLAQILALLVWLAALGGGRWEFRLVDPILPAVALLTAAAAFRALERLPQNARRFATHGLVAALVGSQAATLFLPFGNFGDVISARQAHFAARPIRREGVVLAKLLGPEDRISTGWAGGVPYYTDAWHFDPYGLNDPEIARRPLDTNATVFHQRRARWQDIVDHRVLFCDVFNHFLERAPYDPGTLRMVNPWIPDDAPIYSVRLRDELYWIFTSARPRQELDEWLAERNLEIHSKRFLPPGTPRP